MSNLALKSRDRIGWPLWLVLVSSVLIGIASFRYLAPGAPGGAPPILANSFTRFGALTFHAAFAATALIIGPFQFIRSLRSAKPKLHRLMGMAYVVCCTVAGVAGLLLAAGARTGPVSTAGFGMLAILWIYATLMALSAARSRRFVEHERWMIRSFALTFAAVTLRVYLPFAFMSPWGYDNTYRAISFLCWVPNIVLAEAFLVRSGAAWARRA